MSARNTFDESSFESFLYSSLTSSEAEKYLTLEPPGTFLLRGCTSDPKAYVICIKEHDQVRQYKVNVNATRDEYYVREESKFRDLESLLGFYKRMAFTNTPLGLPITPGKLNVMPKSPRPADRGERRRPRTEPVGGLRGGIWGGDGPPAFVRHPEGIRFARVTRLKNRSVYDQECLDLKIGDIIKIKRLSPNGQLEVEYNGMSGEYPFTMVEMLTDHHPE